MKRSRKKEMMDLPGNPAGLLEEDLTNLRLLNRTLGGYRGVLGNLDRLINEKENARFTLLDVGTGSGDIPRAVVRWARARGISVNIVALEPDPVTAGVARRLTKDLPEISIVRGDARYLPFASASFDFVLASQFLHHFSEREIVVLLRTWSCVARRGLLVSDLIRHPLAYFAIRLLTLLFTGNEMTCRDAPLSIRRAFTLGEWRDLFKQAEIGEFSLLSLFPFRVFAFFSLEGRHGAV